MGSVVESVLAGNLVLRNGGSLKDLAAAILAEADYEPLEQGPQAAPVVEMTPELKNDLAALPHVFGRVQPDEVRTLSLGEQEALYAEQMVVKGIVKVLALREEAIKQTIRGHMARQAEVMQQVTEDTPLDKNGFPIVARKGAPQRANIPGTTQAWSLEYREGTPEVQGERLLELYEAGEITRAEYLAFTKEVRVFDERKAMAAMEKDPTLLNVLRKIVKKGRPSTSLFVRKQSKK